MLVVKVGQELETLTEVHTSNGYAEPDTQAVVLEVKGDKARFEFQMWSSHKAGDPNGYCVYGYAWMTEDEIAEAFGLEDTEE